MSSSYNDLVNYLRDLLSNKRVDFNKQISFPYKKYYLNVHQLNAYFNKLILCKPIIDNDKYEFSKKTLHLKSPYFQDNKENITFIQLPEYNIWNDMLDYYIEKVRIKCKPKFGRKNAYEMWQKKYVWINDYKNFMKNKDYKSNDDLLKYTNEFIYDKSTYCNHFRPSIMKNILDYFKPSSVLDFSSGWGGRLAGCLSEQSVTKYIGIDPNTELFSCYDEIINQFNIQKKECIMINDMAENVDMSKLGNVDLIFTSPPYFDYEVYTQNDTQSIVKHKGLKQWIKHFLLPVITNCWTILNYNGHMILSIEDTDTDSYVEFMNMYINEKLPDASYIGTYAYRYINSKSHRPLFVWKKVKGAKKINIDVKKYYPDLYDLI